MARSKKSDRKAPSKDLLSPLENDLTEEINTFFPENTVEPALLLEKYNVYKDILTRNSDKDVDSRKNEFATTNTLLDALKVLNTPNQSTYEIDNRVDLTFKRLKLEAPKQNFKKILCAAYLLAIESEMNENRLYRGLVNDDFRTKIFNKVIHAFNAAVPDDIHALKLYNPNEFSHKKEQSTMTSLPGEQITNQEIVIDDYIICSEPDTFSSSSSYDENSAEETNSPPKVVVEDYIISGEPDSLSSSSSYDESSTEESNAPPKMESQEEDESYIANESGDGEDMTVVIDYIIDEHIHETSSENSSSEESSISSESENLVSSDDMKENTTQSFTAFKKKYEQSKDNSETVVLNEQNKLKT